MHEKKSDRCSLRSCGGAIALIQGCLGVARKLLRALAQVAADFPMDDSPKAHSSVLSLYSIATKENFCEVLRKRLPSWKRCRNSSTMRLGAHRSVSSCVIVAFGQGYVPTSPVAAPTSPASPTSPFDAAVEARLELVIGQPEKWLVALLCTRIFHCASGSALPRVGVIFTHFASQQ